MFSFNLTGYFWFVLYSKSRNNSNNINYDLCLFTVFQDKPPLPPNAARSALVVTSAESPEGATGSLKYFVHSTKRICSNRSYLLLLVSYGINVGVFYAVSTLLNQTLVTYFPVINEYIGILIERLNSFEIDYRVKRKLVVTSA